MTAAEDCRYYYVDEAGDAALFGKKGRVIIGEQGCSRYFMLGVLDLADHAQVYYTQKKPQTAAALDDLTPGI